MGARNIGGSWWACRDCGRSLKAACECCEPPACWCRPVRGAPRDEQGRPIPPPGFQRYRVTDAETGGTLDVVARTPYGARVRYVNLLIDAAGFSHVGPDSETLEARPID